MTYSEDVNRVKGYKDARIEALEKEVERLTKLSFEQEVQIIKLEMKLDYFKNRSNG